MNILAKQSRILYIRYVLPDILQSNEDLLRFHNMDLKEMDVFFLRQELFKVKTALACIDLQRQPWVFVQPGEYVPACKWLKARYKAVKEELKKRKKQRRQRRSAAVVDPKGAEIFNNQKFNANKHSNCGGTVVR